MQMLGGGHPFPFAIVSWKPAAWGPSTRASERCWLDWSELTEWASSAASYQIQEIAVKRWTAVEVQQEVCLLHPQSDDKKKRHWLNATQLMNHDDGLGGRKQVFRYLMESDVAEVECGENRHIPS